jgi:hypothetical protein
MFGRIIGKVLSTPVRLVNVPLKAASKATDYMLGESNTRRIKDRDPIGLDEIADAIDDACDDD